MVVKYSTSPENNTIKTNSIILGNGTSDYGPTSSTGFWNGITPPSSGYTIYTVSEARPEPSIVVAHNDTEAIYFAQSFGGTNISTIEDALIYLLTGSTGTTIVNMDYPGIVTNGLVFNYDPGFIPSYPRSGITLRDLSGNNNHGTLSGATYSNDEILLSGTDQFISIENTANLNNPVFTFSGWFYNSSTNLNWNRILSKKNLYTDTNGYEITLETGDSTRMLVGGSGGSFAYFSDINWINTGWHHLAVIFNNTSPVLYFDTIFHAPTSGSISAVATNNMPLLIGKINSETTTLWQGKMSNVAYYNRILSFTDVVQNFNATKSRFGL